MRFAIIVAFVTLGYAASAGAAGPYDGNWTGSAAGTSQGAGGAYSGACVGVITATVADNRMRGKIEVGRITAGLGGTIAPDGGFKGLVGSIPFTGKFAGSSFEGSYQSAGNCGTYRVTLKHS